MAADTGLIHVHCGDAAAAVHRKSGLPGRVCIFRDSPAVGPWSADPVRLAALRADWWGVAQRVDGPGGAGEGPLGTDPVLWFGPDPWEQACLLGVLAGLPEGALPGLVPLDRGVARLPPASLPSLFVQRALLDADTLVSARGLWSRFLHRGWGILADEALPALPWLAPALVRLAEDHPGEGLGRTERQVYGLLERGTRDLQDLMEALGAMEDPHHGAWYGERGVARLVTAWETLELG